MDFRILGPLEVVRGDQTLRLGSGRQLALFAVLLLHRNEAISIDRIVDHLWGESPPPTAAKIVRNSVSLLRKALGDGGELIRTQGQGYKLLLPPDTLDADRFELLLRDGRHALADGDAERARGLLGEALALWRGPALADFAYEPFAQREIGRLDELRLSALEERIEADLRLGRHAELVAVLEPLVREHPLRERLRGQLMLALYRAGRQSEALAAYQEGRRLLVSELGLEPGQALQELERAILRQEQALEPPVVDRGLPARLGLRRRAVFLIVLGAAGLLAAAIAVAVLELRGGSSGLASVAPNSLARIDPSTNHVVAEIQLGGRPAAVATGDGSVWVGNLDDSTVTRVDPKRARVVRTISIASAPTGLAFGAGAVWAVGADGVARRIDPRFQAVVARVRTFKAGSLQTIGPVSGSIAAGKSAVWVASGGYLASTSVTRIDPRSDGVGAKLAVGNAPSGIAIGLGSAWVSDVLENSVSRIESSNLVAAPIPVGHGPTGLVVGGGAVWVADSLDDAIVRIDPQTSSVTTTIPVGHYPTSVAFGAGSVWVANSHDHTVSRIDAKTNRVVWTIDVGSSPAGVTVGQGGVWITTQGRPTGAIAAASTGGTLRVDSEQDQRTDPAFDAAPQISYATCAKLLNYPDSPAPRGSRLVPEVARSMPSVSADGRTYTFIIRKGFTFSPPLHEHVNADTFKHAIERSLSPKMHAPAAFLVDDIAGEADYLHGKADHISGVVASGDRLVIRLVKRAPSFPARIATPPFCAVPLNTPVDPRGVRFIPAAGPYYVASHTPGREIVLKRNPKYRGRRPHHLDAIVYTIGVPASKGLARVETGAADYAVRPLPPDEDVRLARRYGPGTAVAAKGGQRYFVNPRLGLGFLALNASRPLFADVQMRRAVSYAIDRRALARLGSLVSGPGALAALPTDQYLPPNMVGFRRRSVYPLSGDLPTARRLAGARRATAVLYSCNFALCRESAQLIRRNLSRIGIDVETKEFPFDVMFERALRPREQWDILLADWGADYADPYDFLNVLLDPRGKNWYLFHFRNERVTRLLDQAADLSGPARYNTYGELAVKLARDEAPWVSYAVGTERDFFSARVGCQVYNPVYGMDLAALCLRRAR